MEYLEGKTLQTLYEELYRAGRQLAYADALDYATQMLDGVEAAHAGGHRPPRSQARQRDDHASTARARRSLKLLDFGIAKLKAIGELQTAGSPGRA